MAPVIHCSAGNIRLFHGTNFIVRNDIHLTKYNASRKYSRLTCYRRLPSPQSSLGLFQISRSGSGSKYRSEMQTVAAVGTDVTVEELSPSVSGDKADETLESPPKPVETTEAPLADSAVNTAPKIKRARPGRKSDMPPVKDEELVVGASFTGKVRSIQPFGAFVDFGAFTDGLVHVSRISEGYVKDIGAVVSIGQEVKVRIVEANMESRRISLTMRDGDDTSKPQQRPDVSSSGSSDKPRPARSNAGRPNQKRGDIQKTSKFVKGQVLDGTVKKLTRSGAFVSLPEGEEGFLPVSEESEGFGNIMGNSSLTVGQEVNVRVLRLTRGVTLTMKKEEDVAGINKQLNQGVVHVATNPFELAFRKNKDIAAFLEEQKKSQKVSENLSTPETSDPKEVGDTLKLDGSTAETGKDQINVSSVSDTLVGDEETTPDDLNESSVSDTLETGKDQINVSSVSDTLVGDEETTPDDLNESSVSDTLVGDEETTPDDLIESSVSDTLVGDEETTPDELNEETTVDSLSGEPVSNKEEPISSSVMNANAIPEIVPEEGDESETVIKSSSDSVSDELPLPTEAKETDVITTPEPELVSESPSAEKIETSSIEEVATAEEANIDTESSGETSDQVLSSEGVPAEEVASSQPDDILVRDTVVAETPELEETEKSESDSKDEIVNASEIGSSDHGGETKATISPSLVKQLREESGAGMMDCKNALTETDGDIVKAQELLRKKGLASADRKASRATAEGRIGAYIHDNRIGVLIEVNCETDFVARGEIFKELVDDLAMQVAACPQVRYLSTEDVPEEFVKKEREIEMQKEDLLTKPEQIRSKIVDGRIKKRLEEFALLEQPFIKNDKMVVKDFVKQTIATIGENINVKRFVRYNLGEGLEKKSQDFAAEVAAQTAAKPSSSAAAAPKEQPAEVEVEKAQTVTVTVSAALVKQLRDETGAGMMDCKKALTETGGDLEKAQEYLRKKGLSSADKKSSRLAAEGRISSYIHDSRIGVLIEVNSETDFVARNEKFKEMVDDLAMQVVACPQVEYVSVEDIPESIVSKEKELEMEREDLKSKPEHIREKIVEGRISKRLGELALLEQAFIKDDGVTVKDLVKQTVAALGENMKVRRFVRFTLGEN